MRGGGRYHWPMELNSSGWGAEGTFTGVLLEVLGAVEAIESLRVEDAPASRTEAGYAFISNEIYVTFKTGAPAGSRRRLGLFGPRKAGVRQMTLQELTRRLASVDGVGSPDYSDEGMIQYLRTERITAPYQTSGFKIVEMVRIYDGGTSGPS